MAHLRGIVHTAATYHRYNRQHRYWYIYAVYIKYTCTYTSPTFKTCACCGKHSTAVLPQRQRRSHRRGTNTSTHTRLVASHLDLERFSLPAEVLDHLRIGWLVEDVRMPPRTFFHWRRHHCWTFHGPTQPRSSAPEAPPAAPAGAVCCSLNQCEANECFLFFF